VESLEVIKRDNRRELQAFEYWMLHERTVKKRRQNPLLTFKPEY